MTPENRITMGHLRTAFRTALQGEDDARAFLDKLTAFRATLPDDPGTLDLARAARVLARPGTAPRAMGFKLGPNLFDAEPLPHVGAGRPGLAGDLLWMLVRCGLFPALAKEIRALPETEADQVMALCACFGDDPVRAEAEKHFAIPDLPQVMADLFAARAKPARAQELADFGSGNPRFRRAIASACDAYALHLYGDYVPCPNWYYDGWSHLTRGHNTSLMSLFLDHPAELPVLEAAIRRYDLPQGLGSTMGAEFSNCSDPLYQAVLLSLCRTDLDRAMAWLDPPDHIARRTRSPACEGARRAAQKMLTG